MERFMYGKTGRDLYVMRAVPGCGKSHRATRLAAEIGGVIYSADHFYGEGEEYRKNWSPQRAHLGHRDCEAKVLAAMKATLPAIIVDNTNISLQGFRTYIDYALDYGYNVQFVYPDSPWWVEQVEPFLRSKKVNDPESSAKAAEVAKVLFEKNTHGVPEATIIDMLNRFQWVGYDDYVEATRQRVVALEKELTEMKLRLERVEKR